MQVLINLEKYFRIGRRVIEQAARLLNDRLHHVIARASELDEQPEARLNEDKRCQQNARA